MRNYKQILEAINRGIQFALDDFKPEDIELSMPKQKTIDKEDSLWQKIQLQDYVVDLGLPSGTLWCKYNLGCDFEKLNNNPKDSKPEDWYGKYYAWGEVETKEDYSWTTYQYTNGAYNKLTKYCNDGSYGNYDYNLNKMYTDNLTRLQPEDDVAYQNMHLYNYKFHMPTKEQFEELKKYTTNKQVDGYEINGKKIIDLNGRLFKGRNGNELFIPAAGWYNDSVLRGIGKDGCLWSSDLNLVQPNLVQFFSFYTNKGVNMSTDGVYMSSCSRSQGLTVRPVINL